MTELHYPDYQTKSVSEFMAKAKQAQPLFPTIPSLEVRMLRAKLILEEAFETITEGLGLEMTHQTTRGRYGLYFDDIKFSEGIGGPDLIQIADGCADLKVVVVGTELACGINGRPVFDEVMRSNMTKDGGLRGDGKMQKGPSYSPPNIEKVLNEQGWRP